MDCGNCGHCERCNWGYWPDWCCNCGHCRWCLQIKEAYNRKTMAGESINLRCQFTNELHENMAASGVMVYIFPPKTPASGLIPSLAVASGIPTYLGDGIYQYTYSVPSAGPAGVWCDLWTGILPYQTVSGLCMFLVDTQAYIKCFGPQLHTNNIVDINLSAGIQGIDGSTTPGPLSFSFLTVTDPSFTDVRKVRLEVGAFIGQLGDDTIQDVILEASIQAEVMRFSPVIYNTPLFLHARREYTTWLAIRILLDNISRDYGVKGKSLGDFAVQYDPEMLLRFLDRAEDRLNRWEGELITAGGFRQVQMPAYSVKGELDPDRVKVGRLWQTDQHGNLSQRVPAANMRIKPRGNRRYSGYYFPFLTTPGSKRGW